LRLTTPFGYNAYDTYQEILNIAPDNPQAQSGLIKIADKYEQLARNDRYNKQKKLAFIEKGLKILPTHQGLKTLHKTLTKPIKIPKIPQVVKKVVKKTEPPVQKMPPASNNRVMAPKEEKPHTPDNTIQNLLKIAQQYFETAQFEAAYQTYKNVLKIIPGNQQAINGLQQIAHRYKQLAKSQSEKGYLQESAALIKKGLAISPTDSGLLALQAEITRRINEKTSIETQQHSPLIFTPSF